MPNQNLYEWKFTLKAPKDSHYSGGFFYLKAIFPKEYPNKGPEVLFITPIYHLQVNPKYHNFEGAQLVGHVWISLLNWWKPETKMKEVIANIFALFFWDNPDSPYDLAIEQIYIKIIFLFLKREFNIL